MWEKKKKITVSFWRRPSERNYLRRIQRIESPILSFLPFFLSFNDNSDQWRSLDVSEADLSRGKHQLIDTFVYSNMPAYLFLQCSRQCRSSSCLNHVLVPIKWKGIYLGSRYGVVLLLPTSVVQLGKPNTILLTIIKQAWVYSLI